MDGQKLNGLNEQYVSCINKVQDYIESNIASELSLNVISDVANFSPFHFHRVFKAVMGESLFHFIQRTRLERAAGFLVKDGDMLISQIAAECGFLNQSVFSKAFKSYFGCSASDFRKTHSMDCIKATGFFKKQKDNTQKLEYSVKVEDLKDINVVYIRYTGPYKGDSALFSYLFEKLYRWADSKGLIHFPDTQAIVICHDNYDITQASKLRLSACVTVKKYFEADGEFGSMIIPGGKYGVGYFELDDTQYQQAWDLMYGQWLAGSRYRPDDRNSFELYPANDSEQNRKKKVLIHIPIKDF